MVGTLPYMSPEQLDTGVPVRTTSDIYSIGVILYELLTRRLPFTGLSDAQIVVRILDPTPPIRPSIHRIFDLPRDLETICLACLRRDPASRYNSAEALRQDLERFRLGKPILMRVYSLPRRIYHWAKARPYRARVVILSLAMILGLITGLVALSSQYNHINELVDLSFTKAQESDRATKEAERSAGLTILRRADDEFLRDEIERAQELLSQVRSPELRKSFAFRSLERITKRNFEIVSHVNSVITSTAITREQDRIACSDASGNIFLYDGQNFKQVLTTDNPSLDVYDLVFSPDSRWLGFRRNHSTAVLDVADKEPIPVEFLKQEYYKQVAFLKAQGEECRIVVPRRLEGLETLQIYRLLRTQSPSFDFYLDYRDEFATSIDGQYLAYGRHEFVKVLDINKRSAPVSLPDSQGKLLRLAFSPDSSLIAVSLMEPGL